MDFTQYEEMMRRAMSDEGAQQTRNGWGDMSPMHGEGSDQPTQASVLASAAEAVKPAGLGAAAPVARKPRMSPDAAAAQLAHMSKGVEAMRHDGPGEAAARELDAMRGGVEGMRRGEDSVEAREAELLRELAALRAGVQGMRRGEVRDHDAYALMNAQDKVKSK